MEMDIFEAFQTEGAGHLGVEAAVAKLSVILLNRAIVHDLVGRDGRTARLAADHCRSDYLRLSCHLQDLVSAREHCRSGETRPAKKFQNALTCCRSVIGFVQIRLRTGEGRDRAKARGVKMGRPFKRAIRLDARLSSHCPQYY
jgi:hypothetical protein